MGKDVLIEIPFWEKEIETLPIQDLKKLQVQRLRETIKRAETIPFYKERFNTALVCPDKIVSLDSIRFLPFTTKGDLRENFPYGLLAVPLEECVRVHASSGTTGSAVAVLHTENDIETWSNLVARCLYGVGVRRSDIFQNIAGYGLFTGGLGFHYGAQKVGALIIPASAGNSKRQVNLMIDFGTTVIHIMPSFALYLIRVFEKMGINPIKDTKLRIMFLGAEPHSEETRKRIEELYGVDAYNSYGLSEMNGPGVSFECHLKDGLHIWEDSFIVEIIDPKGDEPVPQGAIGELVYTTLAREAMPLIRYRSGDLAYFLSDPCPCGRTHRRISRIHGRVDDMIIWKGVNIFPMQIESVLMNIPEIKGSYMVVLETDYGVDRMTIKIEVGDAYLVGEKSERFREQIVDMLQSELLVKAEIQFVPVGTISVSEDGKAKRVIDKRIL
jgi:phenylacetate-CoA ligase